MTFLQPLLLAALPLIALPIIIHLINQRRYQTVRWAAMMFLLAANRMSRGYARIRQWLILLFRTLAVAGLIFAVSRPLASGWLGLAAGGKPDTTIVLLDRSPSMQQRGAGSATSKLDTAVQQLVGTLSTIGSSHWVLIDSATAKPNEIESPEALLDSPHTTATSATADLPGMLQAAYDYIQANRSGRTEIWICSDLRANDWNAESGRWQTLRDAFLELPQSVRINLVAYPQAATENFSLRMTDVRRQSTGSGAELLVSLRIVREGRDGENVKLPLQFEIDGARSEVEIEMTGPEFELSDHPIPLAQDRQRGWGRVSIPADLNPADNEFYFAYGQSPPRHTVIVADDPQAVRPLQLAAEISPHPAIECTVEVISPEQLAAVEWDKVALVLWQTALPKDSEAKLVRSFIDRGGQAIFFPPQSPDDTEFFGIRWQSWTTSPEELRIDTWRGDQDLLAHTQSGAALPVGELQIRKHCGFVGEFTPLAALREGAPLLGRVSTNRGGVYFCATTAANDSNLATDGIVLYVAIQRALAAGSAVLGNTRQLAAGEPPVDLIGSWTQLAGSKNALSTEYPFHAGVYSVGERLLAVNRAAAEDQAARLSDARVAELFRGLDFVRIDGQAGSTASLMHEIWRMFLATMMVALVVEAALCLPKRSRAAAEGGQA